MRTIVMLYGLISYLLFFGVFLYFIAFNAEILVPKTLSSATDGQLGKDIILALLINLALLLLWGVQHTVMARQWFKQSIASFIPHHTERSTYVLASTVVLALLMYAWQPIQGIVWHVENDMLTYSLWALFGLGWTLVLIATFLTDHFDLFGLRQTWLHFIKKTYTSRFYGAPVLPLDSSSDDAWLAHRILGSTDYECRPSGLFDRHDSLHTVRHSL